jgi:hypothetical protein
MDEFPDSVHPVILYLVLKGYLPIPLLVTNNLDPGYERRKLNSCGNISMSRRQADRDNSPELTPYSARFYL